MAEPIDEAYFNWLCAKVLDRGNSIYLDLMRILYQTEFIWVVRGDKNRAEDGCELRYDFLRETSYHKESEWFNTPCSIFEMLVAFAKRAEFQTDQSHKDWFWEFIENLELDEYRQVSEDDATIVEEILHDFVWRTYDSSGYGGIFPLRWPKRDQTEVEIWYQFSEYLDDQGLV